MSHYAFAALIPDATWCEHLLACKAAVRAIAGPQRYLDDPPHLTVFLAAFADPEAWCGVVTNCAGTLQAPTVQIDGWHVFRDDPLTGGHTPVCAVGAAGQEALRAVQAKIIAALAPRRDAAASRERYADTWTRLSSMRQASVLAHGFPFTGQDWHPHVSIGSIAPAAWEDAWSVLAARERYGPMRFQAMHWYQLDGAIPRLLHRLPLM